MKSTVMMEIKRMVMVAIVIVKLKMVGIVKEAHPLSQATVWNLLLIDHSSQLLEPSICSGRLYKASDYLIFLHNLQRMNAFFAANFYGFV